MVLEDFKEFISKGNVLDLAVAVIIGGAVNAVVTALVTDIITPLIGVPGHINFESLSFVVNNSTFLVGLFLNAVLNFVIIALIVFFFIVKPAQHIQNKNAKKASPTTKTCPECLSTIPLKATRCAFCTAKLKE